MRFPPKEDEQGRVVEKGADHCAGCCRKRNKRAKNGGCAAGGSEKTQLLKKQWQNIGQIYVKSTMGPAMQIFF